MSATRENPEKPGIFVRMFDGGTYEVFWLDGHSVVEKARNEEVQSGEPISHYLEHKHVDNFVREMYSPWGEFEGYASLRQLTLHESVHYLARKARICAFLRPKGQASRFIQGLLKGKDRNEHKLAAEVERLIPNFGEDPLAAGTKSAVYRIMESQLLNLTTG
ncbi:MAG: hypothetical protein LBT89_12460 [Planctomycetaceae bacterium]|jgi:hypothetical protein|nr:hypothetical protein [Planctomycetaceae bacterium]